MKLIILGSSATALAVMRDAVSHGLQPVLVDVEAGIAADSRWGRKILHIATPPDDLLPELLSLGQDAVLIATSDLWLEMVMRHREALDRAYRLVLHPHNQALGNCLSKSGFIRFCRQTGLPVPVTWLAGDEPRPPDLQFPVILRPDASNTPEGAEVPIQKAVEVSDEATLAHWLADFGEQGCEAVVANSLLGRRLLQYSVPYAVRAGDSGDADSLVAFVACKRRPLPDRCSVGTFVELTFQAEVLALARRTVLALGLVGMGEVEILHDADSGENFLIEVNPRPWLQYALAPASGYDFLAACLGLPAKSVRRRATCAVAWVDLKSDLFNAFSRRNGAIRRGEMGLFEYMRSLLRISVESTFDWRDWRPAFESWRNNSAAALRRAHRDVPRP